LEGFLKSGNYLQINCSR